MKANFSKVALLVHVTFEVDDEGNKVRVELEQIKNVYLGEEGIWDSMFQRPKSQQRQKQEIKVGSCPYNLVDFFLRVEKRCWANIKHNLKKNMS